MIVNRNRVGLLVAAALAVVMLLFEAIIDIELSFPREITRLDEAQEGLYDACFVAKDDEIHEMAFSTIDNPDVQKEFITSSRADAVRECRKQFPAQAITEKTKFRFNLIDLEPRYW